jgi:hypothetical protein
MRRSTALDAWLRGVLSRLECGRELDGFGLLVVCAGIRALQERTKEKEEDRN